MTKTTKAQSNWWFCLRARGFNVGLINHSDDGLDEVNHIMLCLVTSGPIRNIYYLTRKNLPSASTLIVRDVSSTIGADP